MIKYKKRDQYGIMMDGAYFRVVGEMDKLPIFNTRTLYECYNKPSQVKMNIWRRWQIWFYGNDGSLGVSSYNTNFFSIEGKVHFDGYDYFVIITRTRQEAYIINRF